MQQHLVMVETRIASDRLLNIFLHTFNGTLEIQAGDRLQSLVRLEVVVQAESELAAKETAGQCYQLRLALPEIVLRGQRLPGVQSLSARLLVPPVLGTVELLSHNGKVIVQSVKAESLSITAYQGAIQVADSVLDRLSTYGVRGGITFTGCCTNASFWAERGNIDCEYLPGSKPMTLSAWAKQGGVNLKSCQLFRRMIINSRDYVHYLGDDASAGPTAVLRAGKVLVE